MRLFSSAHSWNPNRPHILVVACSDGRLQVNLDEFLEQHLGINHYDRIYLPGGPGALASSGTEYVRSDRHRLELAFLLEAHDLEEIVLVFHGPGPDGPEIACCADYVRFLGPVDVARIARQQVADYREVRDFLTAEKQGIKVMGVRCEVGADGNIEFVSLD